MAQITTKLQYVIFYFTFMSITIFLTSQYGYSLYKNVPEFASLPAPDITNILATLQWFIAFLSVSTDLQLFSVFILFPMTVGLFYVIVEIIRGI